MWYLTKNSWSCIGSRGRLIHATKKKATMPQKMTGIQALPRCSTAHLYEVLWREFEGKSVWE